MKLSSVLSAKTIWLFDLNRLNPRGLSGNRLFEAIKERYHFAVYPKYSGDLSEDKSVAFDFGEFSAEDGRDIAVSLKIFKDGVVAGNSSSTSDGTAFLEDLRVFADSMGMSFPAQNQLRIGYFSTLQVECTESLLAINPALEKVSAYLASHLVAMDQKPHVFEFTSIGFWSEDTKVYGAPGKFRFERREERKFGENQYYSEAPLQTHEHLELLDELEVLLRA